MKNQKLSNLELHAKKELEIAGMFDKDSDYGGMMGPAIMKMISEFAKVGHSGFSARLTIEMFRKLANFEPLSPLTGGDNEWNHICDNTYQNNRCSKVFKDSEGAYDIDGYIFRAPDGVCYTNKDSRRKVEFPYIPKTEYIDVDKEGNVV